LLSPRLLDQALEFARGLQRSYRAHAIGALAPFVPAERRAEVFNEALSAAASFENPGDLHQLVLSLAPHLPPEAVPAAVGLASTIDDSIWRPHALAALVPYLDEDERRKLGVDVSIASPPVEPAAPGPDVQLQALDEALASVGGDAHLLEGTVAELAPAVAALPREAAAEPAARVVRELGAFERPDALRATTAFVPALLASGDATAVVAAIGDAQAWWP
jgi:hypothetical protein